MARKRAKKPWRPKLKPATREEFTAALANLKRLWDECDFSQCQWDQAEPFVQSCLQQYHERGFLTTKQIRKANELYEKWQAPPIGLDGADYPESD